MYSADRKENVDAVLQKEYTVENVLGTGGFGTVYSGIRKQDNRPVSWTVFIMQSVFKKTTEMTILFAFGAWRKGTI